MKNDECGAALYATLAHPDTHRDPQASLAAQARLTEVETALAEAMARWEMLETIATGGVAN